VTVQGQVGFLQKKFRKYFAARKLSNTSSAKRAGDAAEVLESSAQSSAKVLDRVGVFNSSNRHRPRMRAIHFSSAATRSLYRSPGRYAPGDDSEERKKQKKGAMPGTAPA